jgi:two-component sensor histidine kinase
MYASKDISLLNFSEYLRDLISNLLNSYRVKLNSIDLKLNISDLETNVDLAVYLGLIVNELVSNAFKHAFPDGKGFDGLKGKLVICLENREDNKYAITVKDNGCGFPEGLDYKNTNSLGMQLVNSLVDQIRGTLELKRGCGTEIILTFAVNNQA